MPIKIANPQAFAKALLKEITKRIRKANEEAKDVVLAVAQKNCPEDEGNLRLSLADTRITKITDKGLGFQVGSVLPYAWFVEYGTYVTSAGNRAKKDPTRPATNWKTKVTKPAYKNPAATMPFLRPAFIRNKSKIIAIYAKHLKY